MVLYLILSLGFLQIWLTTLKALTLWPEIYLFSWLVSKGLVPYRDFFDHHGFLVDFIFSFLAKYNYLQIYSVIFLFIQTINLVFIILILKKITNKFGLIFLAIFYTIANYFFMDSNLWFEDIITSLFLLAFFISLQKTFNYKPYILGVIIALASFIKPPAGLILLPFTILKRDWKIFITFTLSWLVVLVIFLVKGGLRGIIQDLFLYNKELSHIYLPYHFHDQKFLIAGTILVFLSLVIIYINKCIRAALIPIIVFFCSFSFLYIEYDRIHVVPLVAFGTIILGYALSYWRTILGSILLFCMFLYMILIVREVKNEYTYQYAFETRAILTRYKDEEGIVKVIKQKHTKGEVYIMDNDSRIYLLLDQLPPTYFPLYFIGTEKFFPNYSQNLFKELKTKNVVYIIVGPDGKSFFQRLPILGSYIQKYYYPCDQYNRYTLLCSKI